MPQPVPGRGEVSRGLSLCSSKKAEKGLGGLATMGGRGCERGARVSGPLEAGQAGGA